jgi:hypothetical protein
MNVKAPHAMTKIRLPRGTEADFRKLADRIRLMNPISIGNNEYLITTQLKGDLLREDLTDGMSEGASDSIEIIKLPKV